MADEKMPWFRFWVSKYRGSPKVLRMSWAERGVYLHLLTWAAQNGGRIEDSEDALCDALVCEPEELSELLTPKVRRCFEQEDGFLVSERMASECDAAEAAADRAKANGQKGGRPSKRQDGHKKADPKPKETQPFPVGSAQKPTPNPLESYSESESESDTDSESPSDARAREAAACPVEAWLFEHGVANPVAAKALRAEADRREWDPPELIHALDRWWADPGDVRNPGGFIQGALVRQTQTNPATLAGKLAPLVDSWRAVHAEPAPIRRMPTAAEADARLRARLEADSADAGRASA
jgi:uncharacterized protein YdaU (DUF1376 family)